MSTLIAQEITDIPIKQSFKIESSMFIESFRLHLLKIENPDGKFQLDIIDTSSCDVIFTRLYEVDIFNTATNGLYGQGLYKFDVNIMLNKPYNLFNKEFTLSIKHVDKTTNNMYYSWCTEWNNFTHKQYGKNVTDGIPNGSQNASYAFNIVRLIR